MSEKIRDDKIRDLLVQWHAFSFVCLFGLILALHRLNTHDCMYRKVKVLLLFLFLLQRSTAVRSSVRLMPQIQPSGRGLLPSPTAYSPDQYLVAMLADVSLYILGRTEGRGLGFGQHVRTHTGKCLKCQSISDGLSDHSALCAGGRQWSAGPVPVSKLGQGVPGIHRFLSSSLHCTGSGEVES